MPIPDAPMAFGCGHGDGHSSDYDGVDVAQKPHAKATGGHYGNGYQSAAIIKELANKMPLCLATGAIDNR